MYNDIHVHVKSRVLRNGFSLMYFKLQKDYRKGDSILLYFQQRYQRFINGNGCTKKCFRKIASFKDKAYSFILRL